MLRNKSDAWSREQHQSSRSKPKLLHNKLPTYIKLSDFMRIQNEINPINAEFENRKAHEEKLKKLSLAKSKNWADSLEMKKKNEFELAKKRFLRDEERRRRIDEEEKKYVDTQNEIIKRVTDKFNKLLYNSFNI